MDRVFVRMAALFVGGAGIASLVGETWWPLGCVFLALVLLRPLFRRSAAERAVPPVRYYQGRLDRRMPS